MKIYPIRQGKCEFADYEGGKHQMTWTVGIADTYGTDRKQLIKKTDIWTLRIRLDDEIVTWFEAGSWNKRPPLMGIGRDAYKMVMALYS